MHQVAEQNSSYEKLYSIIIFFACLVVISNIDYLQEKYHRITEGILNLQIAHEYTPCANYVQPIDSSPMRSPQSVHTAMLPLLHGKNVVEIGTRNGDGLMCFSQVAKSATAIEMDEKYCMKLRERRETSHIPFRVDCSDYRNTDLGDADVFTWWQEPPFMYNEDIARILVEKYMKNKLRKEAKLILLFDHAFKQDMDSWDVFSVHSSLNISVKFDEQELCNQITKYWCSRAKGTFNIGVFPLKNLLKSFS